MYANSVNYLFMRFINSERKGNFKLIIHTLLFLFVKKVEINYVYTVYVCLILHK